MRLPFLALVCLPAIVGAEPQRLTLEQVIEKALAGPRARMARGDRDAAAARIDEANAARLPRIRATAFGTVAHELRTPISGLKGYAEEMLDGVFSVPHAAESISREVDRLERLLGDLSTSEQSKQRQWRCATNPCSSVC